MRSGLHGVLVLAALAAGVWLLLLPPSEAEVPVLARRAGEPSRPVPPRQWAPAEEETDAPHLAGRRAVPVADTPLAPDDAGIEGRVVDARTLEPVANVPILVLDDGCRGMLFGQSQTKADGTYRVTGLRVDGKLMVLALGRGWINAEVAGGCLELDGYLRWLVEAHAGRFVRRDLKVLPAARVKGTVRLPDGTPAAGVRLDLTPRDRSVWNVFPWPCVRVTVTDTEGLFTFDALPFAEAVGIAATCEGYCRAESECLTLESGVARRIDLQFESPRVACIRVVDAVGAPVSGATVSMGRNERRCHPDPGDRESETGVEGNAALGPLYPSDSWLWVRAPGFLSFHSRDSAADAWSLFDHVEGDRYGTRVTLHGATTIRGRVIWPVEIPDDLAVEAFAIDAPEHARYSTSAVVDGTGRFELFVPEGLFLLEVDASSGGRDYQAQVEARSGAMDVRIHPVCTREWQLEAWTMRRRAATWELVFQGPTGDRVQEPRIDVIWEGYGTYPLSADGLARNQVWKGFVEDRPPPPEDGLVRVLVSPDHGPVWLAVQGDALDGTSLGEHVFGPFGTGGGRRTLRLGAPRTIRGRVLDPSGAPVQGASLTAEHTRPPGLPEDWGYSGPQDSTFTDVEGRFALRELTDGFYRVRVTCAQSWLAPAPTDVRSGAENLEFRLVEGVSACLTVESPAGAAVEGACVRLVQTDGLSGEDDYEWEGQTDEQGQVCFDRLDRGGTYDLEVLTPEGRRNLLRCSRKAWRPGNETFTLPAVQPLSGTVRDPEGRPIPGAIVLCRERGGWRWDTTTDASGRFRFRHVSPGPVELVACFSTLARSERGKLPCTAVLAPGDAVDLVLDPGRTVRFEIHRPASPSWRHIDNLRVTPLGVLGTTGLVHDFDLDDGESTVHVRGLMPGVSYCVWGGPTTTGRIIHAILEPDAKVLELRWERGGTIEGHVRRPANAEWSTLSIRERGVRMRVRVRPDGSFELRGVPPGVWGVVAECALGDTERTRTLDASAGDRLTFDLADRDRR